MCECVVMVGGELRIGVVLGGGFFVVVIFLV